MPDPTTEAIEIDVAAADGAPLRVRAWRVLGIHGLALHASTHGDQGPWTITHIPSGLSVCTHIGHAEEAIAVVRALDRRLLQYRRGYWEQDLADLLEGTGAASVATALRLVVSEFPSIQTALDAP